MRDLIGLCPAVKHHIRRFADTTSIACTVKMGNDGAFVTDDGVAIAVFRILQERRTNVARDAQARQVNVHLVELGDEIILIVQHNGCGMQTPLMTDCRGHFRLLGTSERAKLL